MKFHFQPGRLIHDAALCFANGGSWCVRICVNARMIGLSIGDYTQSCGDPLHEDYCMYCYFFVMWLFGWISLTATIFAMLNDTGDAEQLSQARWSVPQPSSNHAFDWAWWARASHAWSAGGSEFPSSTPFSPPAIPRECAWRAWPTWCAHLRCRKNTHSHTHTYQKKYLKNVEISKLPQWFRRWSRFNSLNLTASGLFLRTVMCFAYCSPRSSLSTHGTSSATFQLPETCTLDGYDDTIVQQICMPISHRQVHVSRRGSCHTLPWIPHHVI